MIVEVINDGRPVAIGEWDELVATGLHSFGMPFIRYRLGDISYKRNGDLPIAGSRFLL